MFQIEWITSAIYIGLVYATLAVTMLAILIIYHFIKRNERARIIKLRRSFDQFLDSIGSGEMPKGRKRRFTTRQLVSLVPYFRAIPDPEKHSLAMDYFTKTGIVKVLRRKMHFATRTTRIQIVETLAMFSDEMAQEVLKKSLKDKSSKVRLAAAIALMENDAPWWLYQIVSGLPSSKIDRRHYLNPNVENATRVDKLIDVAQFEAMPPLIRADAINILAGNASDETASMAMTEKVMIDDDKRHRLADEDSEPIFKLPDDDIADDRFSETVTLDDQDIDIERFNTLFADLLDDEALPVIYAAGKALLATGAHGHLILKHTAQHGNPRSRRAARFFLGSANYND